MWLLALETTTQEGSVALLRDDTVVAMRHGDPNLSHAERVPADFAALLAEAGLAPGAIDVFAVATGPGSFTGLRIGLAAIQGLALALDRPAAGVPSLAALAWGALHSEPTRPHASAWLDASRGEVFAAAYRRAADGGPGWPLQALAPSTAATPEATLVAWRDLVPAGTPVVAACREAARAVLDEAGHVTLAAPTEIATLVGRIGWRMAALGLTAPPHALQPEYVRRPDVEIERDRRTAVARAR